MATGSRERFFDPQAAKRGAKTADIKVFGGHGNGGKFYMRQMFKTSRAIAYRDGRMNVFGFNAKRQYGFEEGFEDRKMTLREAMEKAGIDKIELPPPVKKALESGDTGFTVVVGEHPQKAKGSANRNTLVDKLVMHPQARRLIARLPIHLLLNDDTESVRLTAAKLSPNPAEPEPRLKQKVGRF